MSLGCRSVFAQITSADVTPPRQFNNDIPADFETIIIKAMAKQPADRYQTAAELGADLSTAGPRADRFAHVAVASLGQQFAVVAGIPGNPSGVPYRYYDCPEMLTLRSMLRSLWATDGARICPWQLYGKR